MQKRYYAALALVLACAGLYAQNVSLDQAVQAAAQTIEAGLPPGSKVAVLAFTATSPTFTDYVIDELAIALDTNKKVTVIRRQNQDAIRGNVSDDEVCKAGRRLGAQYAVIGSLVDTGIAFRFRIAALNVESAAREASASLNIHGNDPQVVFFLTGQRAAPTQSAAGNTGQRAAPAQSGADHNGQYKVGDKGPAGGRVFYDKGFYSDGWRYLEAAPLETEVKRAAWDTEWDYTKPNKFHVAGTATEIGAGKRNTELIVEKMNERREKGKPAQICISLDIDGYKDWFLPSKDELDLIYKNLKQKDLGGFNTGWYWSSSQGGKNGEDGRLAWGQRFNSGNQLETEKKISGSVRAIRAF